MNHRHNPSLREQGFTLVEALVAMLVLTFGLIAITNLFIVAAGSNTVANHSTAAAAQASEVLERLKSIDFNTLQPGGNLDADVGTANCDPATNASACLGAANYNLRRSIDGVGYVKVRWRITNPGAAGANTLFIVVRAWSQAPLAGDRSRAEFTTFRSCTMGTLCP
jgi:type II secretory pathway pseudopilin PulG